MENPMQAEHDKHTRQKNHKDQLPRKQTRPKNREDTRKKSSAKELVEQHNPTRKRSSLDLKPEALRGRKPSVPASAKQAGLTDCEQDHDRTPN